LIRESKEKNTGNINQHWENLFNELINKFALIEIKNANRQFTWGNNQEDLVIALLDRFLFVPIGKRCSLLVVCLLKLGLAVIIPL
jgi:hypothetical protein